MNNIEKNLNEIYASFFYPSNLNEVLLFLEGKFTKIVESGKAQGMTLNKESEKELMHRLLLEGLPFYIAAKLKDKLKKYEESISEQPLLLAHPSSITNPKMINFIPPNNIEEIIKGDFTVINKKIYEDCHPYEIYSHFKYLYMEGVFEDESSKEGVHRADFILNFHINYFEKSKHKIITELSQSIYALPFELNKNFPNFQLQVNDYVQCAYFRENFSYVDKNYDSSFFHDTGKKLTYIVILFPDEVELSKREITIQLYDQKSQNLVKEVKLSTPLSGLLFKTRKLGFQIPKHSIPFCLLIYYIHGPIDKDNFTC